MRYYKKLNFFFIIFFLTISSVKSNEQIVYLNLDNVISGTKSGKLIIENLKKSRTVALAKFEKKEKELKRIEEDINKQKNILSQEQLTKKISDFRRDISSFRKEREKLINSFNKKKVIEFDKFFKKIVPIIESYVKEKNIDIVLDKKNVFVANKSRDITNEIIKIIDAKIK
tara:strand:+ start:626 stop:1138 length:513 start_codon:yes stop_codon:yes gene_type:complete